MITAWETKTEFSDSNIVAIALPIVMLQDYLEARRRAIEYFDKIGYSFSIADRDKFFTGFFEGYKAAEKHYSDKP